MGFSWRALFVCIALFALGFAITLMYPRLVAWLTDSTLQTPIALHSEPHCDPVQGSCVARHEGMTLKLSLPDPVQMLTPFGVTVMLDGPQIAQIKNVAVTFSMVGMYMGSNRFSLQQENSTTWRGQAMLPICSNGRSDWQIAVEVGDNPSYAAEFSILVKP